VCWILPSPANPREIAGYYTLAGYSVSPGELPPNVAKKLPRYPQIPAAMLGRLAIAEKYKGQGLGEHLLLDAMKRSLDQSRVMGLFALFVDAKDDNAADFYRRYEFIPLPTNPLRLFLPMKTIADLFP
jgi:ribosomal protein S18 acetylase RimI-like enzyme